MADKMIFHNRIIDKGQIKKLVSLAFTNYGSSRTAQLADKLKDLGFRFATKAGVSISVDDLKVPPIKRQLLETAESEIRLTESRYTRGEITEVERFQKVIDTWNNTSETLKDEVVENFRRTDPLNSVYMMAFSGARGNLSQVRQLVGMRGLMADPQGEIIDLPIKTNFREGLTVTEYIISSYGARKGLVDTALRTADSGYLTRRLVDVSQDVIIREIDCGTQRGVVVTAMKDEQSVLIPLEDRLLGRMPAEDIYHPVTKEKIAERNQPISAELAKKIDKSGVESVLARSPLTCEAARSVCQSCYGWSLAHGHLVDLGEAVGIIAAQSIGEPGTQLTMRTFHTGGVFTGEMAKTVRATIDGIVKFRGLRTRPVRTRHGEDREQAESNGDLILEPLNARSKVAPQVFSLTAGSVIMVQDGEKVSSGQQLAEVAIGNRRRTTEKAVKDVATDLAGEVLFADLVSEDKTDRQGNTTRIAQRGGLLWVLSGDVYNLPPGAEPAVKNGDKVVPGSILAETKLVSANGGVVRLPVSGGREIEIITASVLLDKAQVLVETSGGREHYIINTTENQRFSLKATPGTKVQNHQVVAELIDDRYRTQTGGIIKYAGVEVTKRGKAKHGYEVVKGGSLLWIPEECHEVNKDISLLRVEDGQYIELGTEVVQDIFCQNAGIVEVVQKNDILREMVIKPGELHRIDLMPSPLPTEGMLVYPGQEPLPGLPAVTELRYAEYVETPEGPGLLLRPVVEFAVPDDPSVPSQASISAGNKGGIELRAVQRLLYKDGERVKSVDGLDLLRTQLVLEWRDMESPQMAADIELIPIEETTADLEVEEETEPLDDLSMGDEDSTLEHPPLKPKHRQAFRLQLVILESLVIRRDTVADPLGGHTDTRLLVEDQQNIAPGAVVARTEIQCKEAGEVRGIRQGAEAVRRILVMREADSVAIDIADAMPSVRLGNLLVSGSEIAPGVRLAESGQVVGIERDDEQSVSDDSKIENIKSKIILRLARPYRVSPGAILHIDDGDLVQRGDNLVLLVFERPKTGDIIQGLPRIEELLEARKPKEGCILARRPGIASVVYAEDESIEVKVIEADGTVADYPLGPGQNPIISDGQEIGTAEPLTDGPSNPHEILEVFFEYHRELGGIYDAALIGLQKAQAFLVNEVQAVYQSQGIDISDKHIEVIVRQMTNKVRIDDGGDTTMLPGELVELRQVEQVNEAMSITGGAPAQYTPVLLGITKASLNTDSFISAASFQETTRVLTEAAIEGKSDWLRGLKENVIIGRLIPAGTGYNAYEDSISGVDAEISSLASGVYAFDNAIDEIDNEPEDVLDVLDDRSAARIYNIEERTGFGHGKRNARGGFGSLLDDDEDEDADDDELAAIENELDDDFDEDE